MTTVLLGLLTAPSATAADGLTPDAATAPPSGAMPSPPPHVLGIGDSVMLGAAPSLARRIGGFEVDAAVGRQVATALDIVDTRAAAGQLADVVIIDIGNNGDFSSAQFDAFMRALARVPRVIFVNLTVPRAWEGPNNAVIADGVQRYPNTLVVDWHAASASQDGLLWDDGVHLRPAGAEAYADLVAPVATAPLNAAPPSLLSHDERR